MIEVENLVKDFYDGKDKDNKNVIKRAVDGLNLKIGKGEVFGLLGPNGAGKTTTIKMLTMLTAPTEGKIIYDGIPLKGNESKIKRKYRIIYGIEEKGL